MPQITTSLQVPNYASAPSSPLTGQVYYNTTTNAFYYWDGAWKNVMPMAGTATDVTFGTVYLGAKARLVPLSNGLKLEVQDSGNVWQTQAQWTE